MRLLVVSLTDHLSAFLSMLNPSQEVCAFVVDEPEPAKAIAKKFARSDVPVFPYWQLQKCIETFYFDYAINASRSSVSGTIVSDMQQYNIPIKKIISLLDLDRPNYYDGFAKLMMHYRQNVDKYKMFATGISYFHLAIDIQQFTLPTLSFARDSQDLYYDYKIAREVVDVGGGG